MCNGLHRFAVSACVFLCANMFHDQPVTVMQIGMLPNDSWAHAGDAMSTWFFCDEGSWSACEGDNGNSICVSFSCTSMFFSCYVFAACEEVQGFTAECCHLCASEDVPAQHGLHSTLTVLCS
jgi:hypothetical protein